MNSDRARYMRACIRAHAPRDIHTWSDDELLEVFAVIPPPFANYQTFAAQLGSEEPETDDYQLTDKERDSNQWFVDAIAKWKKEHFDI